MNAHSPTTRRAGGCGCQGGGMPTSSMQSSGCSCNGGCSCNKPACDTCADDGFIRPKFFAGQLLTEDDLDLLTQYVGSKNRLHNRFLFGEGVVCGLQVACHPCGRGLVRVLPGYALDCCGNDIVVPCATELNINAMVHQLRVDTLGGIDCGDPCPKPKDKEKEAAAATRLPASGVSGVGGSVIGTPSRQPGGAIVEKVDEEKEPPGKYCLYIRYCEQPSEPVAPYVTDAACGQQTCEPSRIREGFRFEIRCRTQEDEPDDILTRLMRCYGDPKELAELATTARTMLLSAVELDSALPIAQGSTIPPLDANETNELANANTTLDNAMAADRETIQNVQRAAALLCRYILLDPVPAQPPASQIVVVRTAMTNAVNRLRPQLTAANSRLKGLEATWATAVLDLAATTATLSDPPSAQQLADPSLRLLAAGAAYTTPLHNDYVAALDAIRGRLLVMIQRGVFGDCTLPNQVLAVVIPPARTGNVTFGDATGFVEANRALTGVWLRYMIDCFCGTLNPPCKPCDDPAVLLACIEIEDCEVTDICNMERTYVLTPTAFRYWLPPLRLIGRLFELLCCDIRGSIFGGVRQKRGKQSQAVRYLRYLMGGLSGRGAFGSAAYSAFAELYGLRMGDPTDLPYLGRGLRDLAKVAQLRVRSAVKQPANVTVKTRQQPLTFGAVASAIRNTQRETLDQRIDRIVAQKIGALTQAGAARVAAAPRTNRRKKSAPGGAAPAGGPSGTGGPGSSGGPGTPPNA